MRAYTERHSNACVESAVFLAVDSIGKATRLAAMLLVLTCVACSDRSLPQVRATAVPIPLDSAVRWSGSIQLDEDREVINVAITMRPDPLGGFLVADASEAQFRRYDENGSILHRFGMKGGGPGEFERPVVALRLASGGILAIDRSTRAAIFDSAGTQVHRTLSPPFAVIEDADIVNDSLVLVSGTIAGDRLGDQLHIWNVNKDTVVASFFVPSIEKSMMPSVSAVAWSASDVRNDTIAAVFSTIDSIYLFTIDGRPVERIWLPSRHFRPITAMPADMRSNPRGPIEWISTFDLISAIVWLEDGGFLVQHQTMNDTGAFEYGLIRMERAGDGIFEVSNAPRLLSHDPNGSRLYFIAPDSETPNVWATATLK